MTQPAASKLPRELEDALEVLTAWSPAARHAADAARYHASHGIVAVLPLAMPCHMDAFGIITGTDRLLSPAAKILMNALEAARLTVFGKRHDPD